MGHTYGAIIESTRVIGWVTSFMVEEYILGTQAESMRVNIKMIVSMVLDAIHGQMEGSILDNGKIIKDMGKVSSYQ